MTAHLLAALVSAEDKTPDDNSVVAGPLGFVIFIALVIAVALLGWSLSKHLRKARQAADEGVYGPVDPESADHSDGTDGTDGTGVRDGSADGR